MVFCISDNFNLQILKHLNTFFMVFKYLNT